MIRNLKVLGLALVAVFAIGAVVASAASAQGVLTSDGPVTLDVTETGQNALTFHANTVECPGSTLSGHKYNVTPHEFIPSGETTVTITPEYNEENCTAGGFPMTIVVQPGCDYVFHLGNQVSAGTYTVTADIECEGTAAIYFEAFSGSAHGFRVCTQKFTTQTGLHGAAGSEVHVTNTGGTPDDLDVNGTFVGITVVQTGLCGAATANTGEFHVNATVTGTNEAGGATEITISG